MFGGEGFGDFELLLEIFDLGGLESFGTNHNGSPIFAARSLCVAKKREKCGTSTNADSEPSRTQSITLGHNEREATDDGAAVIWILLP